VSLRPWGSSLPPARRHIISELVEAALRAVDPYQAVRQAVTRQGQRLSVAGREYDLAEVERVAVVGAGKAGAPMAAALDDILGDRIAAGWVNVKQGHLLEGADNRRRPGRIHIHEAGHPIPDAAGQVGAERIVELARELGEKDLLICVVSGGGSALLPAPSQGVSLAEKQQITDALLACGATINEMNAVRKHISTIKGGQLARVAAPARVISLILSDVVGSPLDVIASGPTAPDTSTFDHAWHVLAKYGLEGQVPAGVRERLERGRRGEIMDTPKPGDPLFHSVQNAIVADNAVAAEAAAARAGELGMRALILSTYVEGEAREVARVLAGMAKELAHHQRPVMPPACLIVGGETTVTVRGEGRGGRNQELAMAAALALEGWEDVALVTLATDGNDGPTDAAGAVAIGDTIARARRLGLEAREYLQRHDSYPFFGALGDRLLTGPTNTNVNDLTFILAF